MMTSSNGNIFRVTGFCAGNSPATGEFPSQRSVKLVKYLPTKTFLCFMKYVQLLDPVNTLMPGQNGQHYADGICNDCFVKHLLIFLVQILGMPLISTCSDNWFAQSTKNRRSAIASTNDDRIYPPPGLNELKSSALERWRVDSGVPKSSHSYTNTIISDLMPLSQQLRCCEIPCQRVLP